jgi:hypothetical protein
MSQAMFDLRADPLTISLPDPGARLMSLHVIIQDHFNPLLAYRPCRHELTEDGACTRYVLICVRTTTNAASAEDIEAVHRLQDAIGAQQRDRGTLDLPSCDPASLSVVRDSLLVHSKGVPDTRRTFGLPGEVDRIRHLAAAFSCGGQSEKNAYSLNVATQPNDGTTVHRLRMKDEPVHGYWSITGYNEKGFMEKNYQNFHTINSFSAHADARGEMLIQFGGCDGSVRNATPIMRGWNYLVRLCRVRPEALDGSWIFPRAQTIEGV